MMNAPAYWAVIDRTNLPLAPCTRPAQAPAQLPMMPLLSRGSSAIGLLALLVVLAVMNGLIEEDRASVRGPLSDLLLIPGAGEEEASWERYQAVLQEVPEVAAAAPHLVVRPHHRASASSAIWNGKPRSRWPP